MCECVSKYDCSVGVVKVFCSVWTFACQVRHRRLLMDGEDVPLYDVECKFWKKIVGQKR